MFYIIEDYLERAYLPSYWNESFNMLGKYSENQTDNLRLQFKALRIKMEKIIKTENYDYLDILILGVSIIQGIGSNLIFITFYYTSICNYF